MNEYAIELKRLFNQYKNQMKVHTNRDYIDNRIYRIVGIKSIRMKSQYNRDAIELELRRN